MPSPFMRVLCLSAAVLAGAAGCAQRVEEPPLVAPYPAARSVAVLPLLNHSPTDQFDTVAVTDILVAELSQVDGLTVLPTNQPLKILAANGLTHARSIEDALQVGRMLGVDGIVIGAVNEYKPYKPMKMGMTLQLYWIRADIDNGVDPVALGRRASAAGGAYYAGGGPAAQASALFDAAVNRTTRQVEQYARGRQGQDSPFGWRKYLVDSEAYTHFVCHELIVMLMDQELQRITVPIGAGE